MERRLLALVSLGLCGLSCSSTPSGSPPADSGVVDFVPSPITIRSGAFVPRFGLANGLSNGYQILLGPTDDACADSPQERPAPITFLEVWLSSPVSGAPCRVIDEIDTVETGDTLEAECTAAVSVYQYPETSPWRYESKAVEGRVDVEIGPDGRITGSVDVLMPKALTSSRCVGIEWLDHGQPFSRLDCDCESRDGVWTCSSEATSRDCCRDGVALQHLQFQFDASFCNSWPWCRGFTYCPSGEGESCANPWAVTPTEVDCEAACRNAPSVCTSCAGCGGHIPLCDGLDQEACVRACLEQRTMPRLNVTLQCMAEHAECPAYDRCVFEHCGTDSYYRCSRP
jgi:hypothetical protein